MEWEGGGGGITGSESVNIRSKDKVVHIQKFVIHTESMERFSAFRGDSGLAE